MTNEILLEVFKSVSLIDLSECEFEYFHDSDEFEIAINAVRHGVVIDAIQYDGNLFWMMNNSGDFSLLNPMEKAFRVMIPLVDHDEYLHASIKSLYCTSCQALNEQECICNYERSFDDDMDEEYETDDM